MKSILSGLIDSLLPLPKNLRIRVDKNQQERKMKRKTNIWKKAGILVLVAVLVTVAFAGNISTGKENKEHLYTQYGYEILWSEDWFDGTMDTNGGKVAVDSNDNVFVNGYSGVINEHIVLEYDVDGNVVGGFVVDIDDIEYITSVNLESYVEEQEAPIEPCPQELTQMIVEHDDGDTRFHIFSIIIDDDDNIILVCQYVAQFSPPQKHYIIVLKYNPQGEEIWKYAYDYHALLTPGCDSVVDSDGNIIIPCMNFCWSYILKLSPDGAVDWFRLINIRPFWWAQSIVLDSNEDIVVASLDCLMDPTSPTFLISFVKFDNTWGLKMDSGELEALNRASSFHDAALAIDTSDNSIFFGFIDYIYKIDASFDEIVWQVEYTPYINELVVIDNMLITCGGWCYVGDVLNYYSAVYHTSTGRKLLDVPLGPIIYSDDPFFQLFLNQMNGAVVDSQNNILQAGGEGGIRVVKFHITNYILCAPQTSESSVSE